VLDRIEQQPGVVSAGYVNYLPMTFPGGRAGFAIEGRPAPRIEQRQVGVNRAISPGYLATLGVPLLRGRHIDERDRAGAPPVVVINETMATSFWGAENPVGQRIKFGSLDSPTPWLQIIGVVGDVRQIRLDLVPEPELYVALEQVPAGAGSFAWARYLVVRTAGATSATMADVRRVVAGVDPGQPVANLRTMESLVEAQLTGRGVQLTLVGAFSLLSLLLAAVGLYGVLSYGVAQQTSEIGLRMALGASRSSVMGGLLRHTLILTGAGIAVGLVGTAFATRALSTLLYEISPTDPAALATVAVLLAAVAAAACVAPVYRATRIDPLEALRAE
jgi:predicted permease